MQCVNNDLPAKLALPRIDLFPRNLDLQLDIAMTVCFIVNTWFQAAKERTSMSMFTMQLVHNSDLKLQELKLWRHDILAEIELSAQLSIHKSFYRTELFENVIWYFSATGKRVLQPSALVSLQRFNLVTFTTFFY
jgi:hypothetical protein